MPRLIVMSNRTVVPDNPQAGGLAIALWSSLKLSGGLWFGWDGSVSENKNPDVAIIKKENVTLATTSLSTSEFNFFYNEYSNSTLWPVFHNRLDIARFNDNSFKIYSDANVRFVHLISTMINSDDYIWVHDYQLIMCGKIMRKIGLMNRIGFFLHIPFPPGSVIRAIPNHEDLISSMMYYDLIGFQTEIDKNNFVDYITNILDVECIDGDYYQYKEVIVEIKVFPIGIDVEEVSKYLKTEAFKSIYENYREEFTDPIIVSVDRLDYTKGLPQRIHAMRRFFQKFPENERKLSFLQIASPSREYVYAYDNLRKEMDSLSGEINGDFGNYNWSPVKYIHRHLCREELFGLYRISRIGLVTPLCDGMNLVAKEYISCQDHENPGVLILSTFAGAASQLKEALLVNPYDLDEVAEAVQYALIMSREERVCRYQALMKNIEQQDVHWWCNYFIGCLNLKKNAWLHKSNGVV